MRSVPKGLRKAALRVAGDMARENLKAVNPKFHPGPTPLEQEPFHNVIEPQYRERLDQMMKLMAQYAQDNPGAQEAVNLWRTQVAQGTFSDRVKFDFARRFYYWLLGRGTDEDTERTLWGRGNAAVYNPQVREYIQAFSRKRLEYAQQLSLLANRVPDTLYGYYLYFKYIVGGNLKRIEKDGKAWWDMSDEDYLADFEMFHNEFDQPETKKQMYIAKPFGAPGESKVAEEPYPRTPADKANYKVDGFQYRTANTAAQDPVMASVVRNQTVLDRSVRGNANDIEEAERGADASSMAAVFSPVEVSGTPRHRNLDSTRRAPTSAPRMQPMQTPMRETSKGKEEMYPSPSANRPSHVSESSSSSLSELPEEPSTPKVAVYHPAQESTPMGGMHIQTREGESVRFEDLEDTANKSTASLAEKIEAAEKTAPDTPEREAAMKEVESATARAEVAMATVAAAKQLEDAKRERIQQQFVEHAKQASDKQLKEEVDNAVKELAKGAHPSTEEYLKMGIAANLAELESRDEPKVSAGELTSEIWVLQNHIAALQRHVNEHPKSRQTKAAQIAKAQAKMEKLQAELEAMTKALKK